jgi:hypothetical protein
MEKKQTEVEWLLGEVSRLNDENYDLDFGIPEDIAIKAKEIEKKQMKDFFYRGDDYSCGCYDSPTDNDFEEEYNKAYSDDLSDWDVTLMDGLEDEPPFVSDDFQIGPDGAYEHTEEFETKLKSKKKK